jgi:hypothetical protein
MKLGAAVVFVVLAAACASSAHASSNLLLGITDSGSAYYEAPGSFYPTLGQLGAQVLRVQLNWGGSLGVARERPDDPADPNDRAYDWSRYDQIVLDATDQGVAILFTIFGTPAWANGGRLPTHAPAQASSLRAFAFAAARRYSGSFVRPDGTVLPRVRYWSAWNEPNLPIGLVPQWRKLNGRWVIQSARDYARICNAIVDGVHGTLIAGERVACGDTAPRGNNAPTSSRPTTSPLAFLRAMKSAGARGFDAYAHHPYPGSPLETPATPPPGPTAVTLGNLDVLTKELTRLYGLKPLWLDEYGYQTNPPDRDLGVSPTLQARYLTQSVTIARRNPRVAMLLWFLVRDESRLGGWQSGLETWSGVHKPAFNAFALAAAGV